MSTARYRSLSIIQRAGPSQSADDGVVLGVDFGSTNMVAAVYHDDDVDIVLNDIGARTTPSCVHVQVDEGAGKAGSPRKTWEERQTGEAALRLAVTDPDKTIRNVKRIIGRPYPSVSRDPGSRRALGPAIRLASGLKDAIKIRLCGTTDLSPEEVVGTLLLDMKKSSENHLNRGEIKRAVIAVPTYFNMAQRYALIDAAKLAGLKVVQLVNETTAAALAYAHEREGDKTVIIVDIGGGGGSVAVAKVHANAVHVVATCGKRLPGGEDFDARMLLHLKEVIKTDHAKEVKDARSLEILRSCWEKAKQKLSRIPQVELSTYLPGADLEFKYTITRAMFDAQCEDLVNFIVAEVGSTLETALERLEQQGWDAAVLVGGSTRIPFLRASVDKLLNGTLSKALNPDEAVAKGAALLAAGAVRIDGELLGLPTAITMDKRTYTVPTIFQIASGTCAQRPLPACIYDRPRSASFCVEQANPYEGGMVIVHEDNTACPLKVGINISSMIEPTALVGSSVNLIPPYCLDQQRLFQLKKKMEKQSSAELVELARAKAKNALENFLREELSTEVLKDKWQKEEENLKVKCQEILDDISTNNQNLTMEQATELLTSVQTFRLKIDEPRAIEALLAKRAKVQDELTAHLEQLLLEQVPENDAAFTMVRDHRATWISWLEWARGSADADLVQLEEHLAAVKEAATAMRTLREDRRKQARTKLRSSVDLLTAKVKAEYEYIHLEELEEKMQLALKKCEEKTTWLDRHPNSQEAEFERHLSDILTIQTEWHNNCRDTVKHALQHTLQDAIAQCPQNAQSRRYLETFTHIKTWLDSESETSKTTLFLSNLQTVKKEFALMKQDIRSHNALTVDNLKSKIKEFVGKKVSTDVLCYTQALQFNHFCEELTKWLDEHPAATEEEVSEKSTEFHKQLTDLRRSQREFKKMQIRKELSQHVRYITCRKKSDTDVARDLDEALLTFANNFLLPALMNEKATASELQFFLDDVTEKKSTISLERLQRVNARYSLEGVLDSVKKAGHAELAAPHLQWLEECPACPADEFDKRRLQVLAAAGINLEGSQTKAGKATAQIPTVAVEVTNSKSESGDGPEVKQEIDSEVSAVKCIPTKRAHEADEGPHEVAGKKKIKGKLSDDAPTSDEAMMALMAALWDRARDAPCDALALPDWPAAPLAPQAEVAEALAEALAVGALREAEQAGAMVLLLDKHQAGARSLLALSARYMDVKGQAVERLVAVRHAEPMNSEALARAFVSLCERAEVVWEEHVSGLCVEAAGWHGKVFLQRLATVAAQSRPLMEVANAALPLDDRVARACYARLRGGPKYRILCECLSAVDTLRRLFAEDGRWFPLLSLKQDPWRTYTSSIGFLLDQRKAIAVALGNVSTVEPSLYRTTGPLEAFLLSDVESTICMAAFRELFVITAKFREETGLPDAPRLDRADLPNPLLAVDELVTDIVARVRSEVSNCEWIMETDKLAHGVVSTCVEVTAIVVEDERLQFAQVAKCLSDLELGPEQRATLGRGGIRQRFPDRYLDVALAVALPVLPPHGPRSADLLRRVCEGTAPCPADRVAALALLLAHPRDEPAMREALLVLQRQ